MAVVHRVNITLLNPGDNNDVAEMQNAMLCLGYDIQESLQNGVQRRAYTTDGKYPSRMTFQFRESATALRLWIGACAAIKDLRSEIRISPILRKRGYERLLDVLETMDGYIIRDKGGLIIRGKRLKPDKVGLGAIYTSQFHTSLMLASPLYGSPMKLSLTRSDTSSQYAYMTLKLMRMLGSEAHTDGKTVLLPNRKYLQRDLEIKVESDWSAAAVFAVVGALLPVGLDLAMQGLSSLQPDARILLILRGIGAIVDIGDDRVHIRKGQLRGRFIPLNDNPDLGPVLAVLGLFCDRELILSRVGQLVHKESNRIKGIRNAIKELGGQTEWKNESLTVYPLSSRPPECVLDTQNDHRLAMAFSIVAAIFPQVKVSEVASTAKSDPGFVDRFRQVFPDLQWVALASTDESK